MALFVDVIPETAQDFKSSDLVLRWGDKPDAVEFAYQLAEDELVVIVNSNNPNSELSTNELTALFNGRVENWTDISIFDEQVSVWIFPEGNHISEMFDSIVLGDQSFSRLANLAPSPGPMLEEVSSDPGAIGFVPQSWLTPGVSQSDIDPDIQILLRRPLLALTNSEPPARVRDLLACLQTGDGQEILNVIYSPISN